MTTSGFWDNVLEPNESLLWTGRPKPRLHWRNWRLYGQTPMAVIGLMAAAWFIISTYGSEGDIWLLILPAMLLYIPVRATILQLKTLSATRYALTDQRVLFFQVTGRQTRVKAHPLSAITPPTCQNTAPLSINFLRYDTGTKHEFGFEYIEGSDDLLPHLAQAS